MRRKQRKLVRIVQPRNRAASADEVASKFDTAIVHPMISVVRQFDRSRNMGSYGHISQFPVRSLGGHILVLSSSYSYTATRDVF
jgi:hypothetical protein